MSTRTISTRLAVDGEESYKQAIAKCNAELLTFKSQINLVETAFKGNANGMDALSEKVEALEGMYEKQAEKVSKLREALHNCQKAQDEYAARVSTASENIERCENALERLGSSTGSAAEEQKALTAELDEWKGKLSEAEAGQAAAERGVQNWQRQLNNAGADLLRLDEELEKNKQYLSEAESSTDGCAASIDKYGKEVKKAGEESKGFGEKSSGAVETLAQALAAAGLAEKVKDVTAALYDCVETFSSFESQMSAVQSISGATGEEMAKLAAKAKEMGASTKFTATEAGQAYEYMAMAGWKSRDMLDGLEGIMNAAAASGEDLGAVADIVTDGITAFGLTAADSGHFVDVLAAASSNANTNIGMMGETFKHTAPVAGALGYTVEDTALAIGLMANAGIKGSQAGTALRGMLSNLAKPSEQAARYMDKLGISLTDSEDNVRSLSDLMEILRREFDGLTEAQKAEYAAGIAGTEAMSGLLAVVNASERDYQKLEAAITECNGAAEEMAQTKLDNYQGQLTLLESAVYGFKVAVGETLTPALGAMAEAGTEAFSWAAEFVEENPWLVQAFAGAAGGVAVLTGGLAAYTAASAAAEAVQAALNTTMSLCPVVAVAAAIGGLVAVLASCAAGVSEASAGTDALTASLEKSKGAYEALQESMGAESSSVDAAIISLENLLAVEEKSAVQKELIQKKVEELNEKIPGLALAYDAAADSINVASEALEKMADNAGAQKEYAAQMERLNELGNEQAQIENQLIETKEKLNEKLKEAEWDSFGGAMNQAAAEVVALQQDVETLTAAQEENAAQIEELTAGMEAYSEAQADAAAKSAEMTARTAEMETRIDELAARIKQLNEAYQEAYAEAYNSITTQLGLFNELDGTAKTSVGHLIDTLKGQVAYMETYAENMQRAMEKGVDEGLVRKLMDGSEESAQILASIVKGGQEDIQALNEEFARVEEGKKTFSQTVADMETDFKQKTEELVRDLNDAVQDMDVAGEAYQIGMNNMQGLIDGAADMRGDLVAEYEDMAYAALEAYRRIVDQASPSKKFKQVGRYDIQGIIQGAKEEKRYLAAAYEENAKAALSSMKKHLPSTLEAPSPMAAAEQRTAAILETAANRENGPPIQIYVDRMEVRDNADVENVARALYYLTEQKRRERGRGTL